MSWGLVLNPNHTKSVQSLYDYHAAPHRMNDTTGTMIGPSTSPNSGLGSFTQTQWGMLAPQQQQNLQSGYGQVTFRNNPNPNAIGPNNNGTGLPNLSGVPGGPVYSSPGYPTPVAPNPYVAPPVAPPVAPTEPIPSGGATQPTKSNYMITPRTFAFGNLNSTGSVAQRRGWGGAYFA